MISFLCNWLGSLIIVDAAAMTTAPTAKAFRNAEKTIGSLLDNPESVRKPKRKK